MRSARQEKCFIHGLLVEGRQLIRSYSRPTRQAEEEVLYQLRERNFSQIKRELGVGYSTLRRILEKKGSTDMLEFLKDKEEIYLGIDEHSFRLTNIKQIS